jgi:hypothetical protein
MSDSSGQSRNVEPRRTLTTAVVLTGSRMTRLTEQKTEKLCLIGAIPNDHCDRFGRAVERCVRTYRRLGERKSAPEVEAELAQIEKCIWRALRQLDHATWRPAEFRRVLEDISARLHHLSPAAQDYLDFRHLKIQADGVLGAWPDSSEPGVLVDPHLLHKPGHNGADAARPVCELPTISWRFSWDKIKSRKAGKSPSVGPQSS